MGTGVLVRTVFGTTMGVTHSDFTYVNSFEKEQYKSKSNHGLELAKEWEGGE